AQNLRAVASDTVHSWPAPVLGGASVAHSALVRVKLSNEAAPFWEGSLGTPSTPRSGIHLSVTASTTLPSGWQPQPRNGSGLVRFTRRGSTGPNALIPSSTA